MKLDIVYTFKSVNFGDADSRAATLNLTIEGKPFQWSHQYITGLEIKKLGKLPTDAEIYLTISDPWKDEVIHDADKVDLARPGIEGFYMKKELEFFIEKEKYKWKKQYITGAEIRTLGKIESDSEIYLSIEKPWDDEPVTDDTRVDLARPGLEHFYSVPKYRQVTIHINGTPFEVLNGTYTVTEIKKKGNVPAAHELEQLIDGKLTPLADNGTVEIEGCEEFFSHVRDGSSS